MSDRDFYNLRELIRKLQRRVDYLEQKLGEQTQEGGGRKSPIFMMLTDDDMKKIFDEMLEHFDQVADPRFQPKQFLFQLKSYIFYKERKDATN